MEYTTKKRFSDRDIHIYHMRGYYKQREIAEMYDISISRVGEIQRKIGAFMEKGYMDAHLDTNAKHFG